MFCQNLASAIPSFGMKKILKKMQLLADISLSLSSYFQRRCREADRSVKQQFAVAYLQGSCVEFDPASRGSHSDSYSLRSASA